LFIESDIERLDDIYLVNSFNLRCSQEKKIESIKLFYL